MPKVRYSLIALICVCTLWARAEEDDDAVSWIVRQLPQGRELPFVALPGRAEEGIAALIGYAEGRTNALDVEAVGGLISFIRANRDDATPWRPESRWGAEAAGILTTLPVNVQSRVELIFNGIVPDHAKLPNLLRYADILDREAFQRAFDQCVTGQVDQGAYAGAAFLCMEETTPNPQSGAYYGYTNVRTLIRVRIDGQDALFSYSRMHPPSSVSLRGAPVGSENDGLYFYSSVSGTSIPGVTWAQSQMYVGNMLSAYVGVDSNQMAQGIFSWVNAGWRGINVTRASHIFTVLERTIHEIGRQAAHPDVSDGKLVEVVNAVEAMSDEEINAEYERYCDYVRTQVERDSGGLFSIVSKTPLETLFSEGDLETMDMRHRQALVLQERVRALLDMQTWSAPARK